MPNIQQALAQAWNVHQGGDVDQAERLYREVIGQAPESAEALVYLGIALFDQRRFDESAASYRAALELKAKFPIAWNNLGNSLRMLGETAEADDCFEQALSQDPRYLSVFKNRGTLWIWSGEIERGLEWYERGLAIAPQDAELHRNLGVIYLLQGDYKRGWPEYRWRWKMPGMHRPASSAALWTGQKLEGKSILLYAEQGRGDEMHFVRLATRLSQQGAQVIVRTDPQMIPLFRSVSGVRSLIPTDAALPLVDYQASLFDVLDGWYQTHGELPDGQESFRDMGLHRGYLNVSDALVDYWAGRLSELGLASDGRKRVGIVWQGNPGHHADVYRSVPLEIFRPLAEDPSIRLISLQFGFGSEQLDQVDFGDSIGRLPADTDRDGGAFTDTAAVMKNLDRVVTIDTSLVHLAGALGVPATLMLGKVPDWRWLRDGESTSWYPSLKLARQQQMGQWDDVIATAHADVLNAPAG